MQASLERLRRRREEQEDEGGFTLIELLIVIVILGILAAIVVFAVQNLGSSSSQAACGSDYKTVETATEGYKAQIGVYPGAAVPSQFTQHDPATAAPAGMPAATSAGDTLLMSTYTYLAPDGVSTVTIGPWLKDYPNNPGHYSVGPDTTTTPGAVLVYNGAATPVAVASCAALNS